VKYTFKPATGITLEDSGLATQHLTVKSGPAPPAASGCRYCITTTLWCRSTPPSAP
jgi:hypothetical protein